MLKFAVQPGTQNQQGQGSTPPNSNEAHIHSGKSDSNNNETHNQHSSTTTEPSKKGDFHDCAICSARRLVITQEKSLVRRARSRSRDRLQRHRTTSTEASHTCSDQSSTDIVSDSSSTDAPTVIERNRDSTSSERLEARDNNHNVSRSDNVKCSSAKEAKVHGLAKTKVWRSMDETSTSSSDADSSTKGNVKRSRSSSRGRKKSASSGGEKSRGSVESGSENARRSRSHSRGRKRSTSSIENSKHTVSPQSSDTERKDGQNRKSRSNSRGRSSTRQQCVVSDTELLTKNSSESENEIGRMPHSKSGGRLDLRAINGESKYRESCLTDVKRRVSTSSAAMQSTRKVPRGMKDREVESCDESRRHSDPAEMLRVRAKVDFDRRCSLPATDTDGLMCASYKVPRISSVVRKATVRKCRSELDGFLSDSKSSSCGSDAESTSSGRHSTTSDILDHVSSEVIYECDEDSASCVSVAGSCASDNSLMSTSSSNSGTANDILNLPSLNDEASSAPTTPLEDNANSTTDAFCTRSPSFNVSCPAYCSDSGVSCFEGINPLTSQTRTSLIRTGEKTVARVRRLNTKTRRSNVGALTNRREGNRVIKDDNASHLNSKELEMLIVSSCFGTGKCFESHDTSDYESEPGSESLTDFECQLRPSKRSSPDESSIDSSASQTPKIPSPTAASRLAGTGQSYSPVKASRDRYRHELAKMPKSDFRYKVSMQHSHKALSSIELTLKQGASIYLHHKELEILRKESPIWVMAYSKSLGRIGFVPAVYVNIRLEDIV